MPSLEPNIFLEIIKMKITMTEIKKNRKILSEDKNVANNCWVQTTSGDKIKHRNFMVYLGKRADKEEFPILTIIVAYISK